ncbi:MAG TPA: hypothetical protein VNQ55_02155 [Parapedobacter sp.]|nr:hypothetical protein [Parapedobacter sp.]
MITLSVVITVVSIPLISAMHSHVQHVDRCDDQHSDTTGTDGTSTCDFCALYAQFVPREAAQAPSFSFRSPVMSLLTIVVQPRPKALCKGLANGYTTRGPPSIFA